MKRNYNDDKESNITGEEEIEVYDITRTIFTCVCN